MLSHHVAQDRNTAAGGSCHLHDTDRHVKRPRSARVLPGLRYEYPVDLERAGDARQRRAVEVDGDAAGHRVRLHSNLLGRHLSRF